MRTIVQDDTLLLHRPDLLAPTIQKLHWLGVDTVRVTAEWRWLAPDGDQTQRPNFDATDPGAYALTRIGALDRAISAAAGAGMQAMIDIGGNAPQWASTDAQNGTSVLQPDVGDLADFASMLARRYDGTYKPPGESSPLPAVRIFTVWNEPNYSAYVRPQVIHGTIVAADWYRAAADAVYPAVKARQPDAMVLIGATSSTGGDNSSGGATSPLSFLRRLACVDARLHPIATGACANFKVVAGDGYSHHPYERTNEPWVPAPRADPGWARVGDLPRLDALLARLVRMHRLAPGARHLWLTEQGYETNGQVRNLRWSEAQQGQLNAISEYLAWRAHSKSFAQFLLRDTLTDQTQFARYASKQPHARVRGTWQTGLMRQDGRPKPGLAVFRNPLVVRVTARRGGARRVLVWGRARPARHRVRVIVQQSSGHGRWTRLQRKALRTDSSGVFSTGAVVGADVKLRFRWLTDDAGWETSPSVAPVSFPLDDR